MPRFNNPFDQSDRDPIGRQAGKGDRDRSVKNVFNHRFPSSMGPRVRKKSRPKQVRIIYGPTGKKVVEKSF